MLSKQCGVCVLPPPHHSWLFAPRQICTLTKDSISASFPAEYYCLVETKSQLSSDFFEGFLKLYMQVFCKECVLYVL